MQRKRKIPNKPNFKRATQRAYELLIELDIKEFPVDPLQIFKEYSDHWHLHSWTEWQLKTGDKDPLDLKKQNAEAKTVIFRGTNEYLIVYDDNFSSNSKERVRWTLAHEIGHILLGHLVYFEETALNRCGLTEEQHRALEVEAHWFAGMILAPHCVLCYYNITDSQIIAFLCSISKEASEKCEKYLKNYRSNYPELESILRRNFYDFFYQERFRQIITEGIYKFYNSYLYDDFFPLSRICMNCKAYIAEQKQEYCHICGKHIPIWGRRFRQIQSDIIMEVGGSLYLQGKSYPIIETKENGQVLYCPVCVNHEFSKNAAFCKICSNPLENICLKEKITVSGDCRCCPECGSPTRFYESGLYDKLKEVELPDLLTFEECIYEDYIEYEHWNYIRSRVYPNLELYSALTGSRAIRNEESFVVFAANSMSAGVIIKHKNVLIDCINNYGLTKCTEVRCYHDL